METDAADATDTGAQDQDYGEASQGNFPTRANNRTVAVVTLSLGC